MTDKIIYLRSSDDKLTEAGECGGALTTTLKYLLENQIVDGVLTVKKGFDVYDAMPVLINDPVKLRETAGSLHCGTQNVAKILVKYFDEFKDMKLAVTVKPCEADTLQELSKRGKINLKNIIMMGVNCGGTFPPVTTRFMIEDVFKVNPDEIINEEIAEGKFIVESEDGTKNEIKIDQLENGFYEDKIKRKNGSHHNREPHHELHETSLGYDENYGRRDNCRRCKRNIARNADLGFGNWGVNPELEGDYSCVEVLSKTGENILNKAIESGYLLVEDTSEKSLAIRTKIDSSMVKLAKKWQLKDFQEKENQLILNIFTNYQQEFEKCIKCFGCRNACPICYCEECTLELSVPEWVEKGKIPPSPLFHLERLAHMVESCTNCGQCQDVCPVDIPLARIWHQINLKINEIKSDLESDQSQLVLFENLKRPE